MILKFEHVCFNNIFLKYSGRRDRQYMGQLKSNCVCPSNQCTVDGFSIEPALLSGSSDLL